MMVSVGEFKFGVTQLTFVYPGAKIDSFYHRNVVFSQLLPAIRQISDDFFISSAGQCPGTQARDTINLL